MNHLPHHDFLLPVGSEVSATFGKSEVIVQFRIEGLPFILGAAYDLLHTLRNPDDYLPLAINVADRQIGLMDPRNNMLVTPDASADYASQ